MKQQSKERMIFMAALLVCCIVSLAGCISTPSWMPRRDTSPDTIETPHTDAKTDTRRESCIRACNHDHDICNDGPSSRNETFDAPQQFVGAAAGCDASLRDCLKSCK